MKKIKNKFIIIIITFLVTIIWIIFIQNINNSWNTSSVILRDGWAQITRNNELIVLDVKRQYSLTNWDVVKTLTPDSLLIITWWDWSITRLWWNSSIQINTVNIASDLSEIQISFELISWRTWSNVTSFFWEESYFLETFNDHEAAVRGTTFDIDLNKEFLYVTSHAIELKNNMWETIKISESKPFSIKSFSFIPLIDYIKNYKDQKWQNLNKGLDKLHFEDLKNIMLNNLESTGEFLQLEKIKNNLDINKYISELNIEEKSKLYNNLLEEYQSIHFANAETPELLTKKIELKEVLILTASDKNKKHLIQSTVYDIKEVFKTNNALQFKKILDIFIDNKDTLNNLNLDVKELLSFKNISKEFNLVVRSKLDILKNTFSNIQFWDLPKISEEQIKTLLSSWDEAIKSFLDSNIDGTKLLDIKNKASWWLENILNTLFKK
jgi:hypothetical protein